MFCIRMPWSISHDCWTPHGVSALWPWSMVQSPPGHEFFMVLSCSFDPWHHWSHFGVADDKGQLWACRPAHCNRDTDLNKGPRVQKAEELATLSFSIVFTLFTDFAWSSYVFIYLSVLFFPEETLCSPFLSVHLWIWLPITTEDIPSKSFYSFYSLVAMVPFGPRGARCKISGVAKSKTVGSK